MFLPTAINFRKIYLAIYFFLFASTVFSQTITQPTGAVITTVKKTGVTTPGGITSLASNEYVITHSYVDGFGRPLEQILVGASGNGKDLVSFNKYDEFGRQTKSYLPFEYNTTASEPYQSLSTAITNQADFYTNNTSTNKIAADAKPWVQSDIEQSPMQRLLKQGGVGDSYQPDQTHYKILSYRNNTTSGTGNDNSYYGGLRIWAADGTSSGTYAADELNVAEMYDDAGASNTPLRIIFTDKLGRLILKRERADETIGGTTYDYFDTYYIYDQAGNVSYIIPPKAVVKMNSAGWNVSNVPNLYFHYEYDNKNRVVKKKVPNAATVYIVYDPLDRPVLVQDGNMRASNKWFYTKYDSENRTVIEGLYTDATHTAFIYDPSDGSYTGSTNICYYVAGLSCYGSGTNYYEDRSTSGTSYYTNNCFPTSSVEERIYCYYDNYDYNNDGTADFSYANQSLTGELGPISFTHGLPTVVIRKNLAASPTVTWLISATFYDKYFHPIQTVSNNHIKSDVTDLVTNVVDFGGRVTTCKEYHSIVANDPHLVVLKTYSYDKMDRLLNIKQASAGAAEMMLAKYEYNSLGQLVTKKLHSTNSPGYTTFLQKVDYRYNIRGQLKTINGGSATFDDADDVFGMELLYDNTDAGISNTANYTGLISAVKWRATPPSGGNTDERSYKFSYDKLYRLTTATYQAKTGSSWTKDVNGFDENMTYDWNGNILTLQRKAIVNGYSGAQLIDDLSYCYGTNCTAVNIDNNQLLNVTEHSTNANNALGFNSASSSSYVYDDNGNLATDPKKGITIYYNEMNKPKKIEQASTGKYIEFTYDAAGIRLSKKTHTGSTDNTVNYVAGIVYDNSGNISYFATAEGRIRWGMQLSFEYFITDQQGNVRVSFEDGGSGAVVRQENSYYPYGMIMPGNYSPSNPNKKLYNAGSEWQDEFDIANYYSTFFREYDPILGRFNSVDPMAAATAGLSIYHYSSNNPVNFNDPLGNLAGVPTYRDVNGNKWHSPTTFTGTGFENYVFAPDGSLMPFDQIGDWRRITLTGSVGFGSDGGGGNPNDLMERLRSTIQSLTNRGWNITWIRFGKGRNGTYGYLIGYGAGGEELGNLVDENIDSRDLIPGSVIVGRQFFSLGEYQKQLSEAEHDWELAKKASGVTLSFSEAISKEGMAYGFRLLAKFSGDSKLFLKVINGAKTTSRMFAALNGGLALGDMFVNGVNGENSIDLAASTFSILFPEFGVIYAGANLISYLINGKSLAQNLSENINDPLGILGPKHEVDLLPSPLHFIFQ
jgi:RHS repeat-associated protein